MRHVRKVDPSNPHTHPRKDLVRVETRCPHHQFHVHVSQVDRVSHQFPENTPPAGSDLPWRTPSLPIAGHTPCPPPPGGRAIFQDGAVSLGARSTWAQDTKAIALWDTRESWRETPAHGRW